MPFADIIGHTAPIGWLRCAIQSNKLGHAYLFVGEDAIGKRLTAVRMAQSINCKEFREGVAPDPCGECQSCYQIDAQIHPDYLYIRPDAEGPNPQIRIERVREIEHHVVYRPLVGTRKICLIDEVDRLTIGAANALLKTLEEPPDHCLFLLITSRPSSLLPTIISRCLVVRFSPSSPADVKTYLMKEKHCSESEARLISCISGGRVGEALQIDSTEALARKDQFLALFSGSSLGSIPRLLDTAEGISKGEVQKGLNEFWIILRDILLVNLHCDPNQLMYREDFPLLQSIAKQTRLTALLDLLDELQTLENGLNRNFNLQLGFERLLIHLREAVSGHVFPTKEKRSLPT